MIEPLGDPEHHEGLIAVIGNAQGDVGEDTERRRGDVGGSGEDRRVVAWPKRAEQDRETLLGRELGEQAHAGAADEETRIIEGSPRDAQELITVEHSSQRGQRRCPRLGARIGADQLHQRVPALLSLQGAESPDQPNAPGGLEHLFHSSGQRRFRGLHRVRRDRPQLWSSRCRKMAS